MCVGVCITLLASEGDGECRKYECGGFPCPNWSNCNECIVCVNKVDGQWMYGWTYTVRIQRLDEAKNISR